MTEINIDHVAIKVANIENLRKAFEVLGIECGSTETYNEVGMKIAFLDTGENKIELLEVIDENSLVAKDKLGIHHIALYAKNIESMFNKMKESQLYNVMGEIRKGAHNRKIFFFKIKDDDVLYECVEDS